MLDMFVDYFLLTALAIALMVAMIVKFYFNIESLKRENDIIKSIMITMQSEIESLLHLQESRTSLEEFENRIEKDESDN